jgi:hypothetical protein
MNTSNLNEIKAAGANTRYRARGMPAFVCRFGSKTAMKRQKLATQGGNHKKKPAYETLESFMRWLYSQQSFVVEAYLALTLQELEHSLLRGIGLSQHRSSGLLHDLRAGQLGRGLCVISIFNLAARCLRVHDHVGQVVNDVL